MGDQIPDSSPDPVPRLPIAGTQFFYRVRRIYCVGRNYASHIREMSGNEREPPFFFQKPPDAIVLNGQSIPYPPGTRDFQHEVELVLAIGGTGTNIGLEVAANYIFGLAVGIDLTRRDLQVAARKNGRPWEIGKSFDHSAPVSAIHAWEPRSIPTSAEIRLSVNGQVRQHGDLAEMIWKPPEIVSQLSRLYKLEPGDLIYTGTPAGVGPIVVGDELEGSVEGIDAIRVNIVE